MKKVEELKDLGCSVRGRFYDLAWSKPVLRAPAVHGVSSTTGTLATGSKNACQCAIAGQNPLYFSKKNPKNK